MNNPNKHTEFDQDQIIVIEKIKQTLNLFDPDNNSKKNFSFADKSKEIKNFIFRGKKSPQNIYLYGPVGRGKSTIIQNIFDMIDEPKQKIFFDIFLHNIYKNNMNKNIDLLFNETKYIWIDEVQIYDISTATILKKIIPEFINRKKILLMTGNVEPGQFYRNGLQYEHFYKFIEYFTDNFLCIPLYGKHDYRTKNKHNTKATRFWIESPSSKDRIHQIFLETTPGSPPKPYNLQLNMREWILEKTIHNSVFLSFNDLAEGNRNINDYKILIDRFSNIYLTDVPIFTSRNLDSCRRFMSFIDILYDQNKSLWMEAHQFPTDLYQDQNNSLPFNRTSSRLAELLS